MITVCVPALNEADNIPSTLRTITTAARLAGNVPIEIIVVNDGSRDRTGEVAETMKGEIPGLSVIHQPRNMGIGAGMRAALKLARYPKFVIVPGDNDMSLALLMLLFRNAERADVVMCYYLNKEVRGVRRNVVSTLFGAIYMITFRIFVQYITGPCIYPTVRLRQIDTKATRFSVVVEATIKLLCSGATYYEVGGYMQTGLAGSTSFSLRNLAEVVRSYVRLVYEIKIRPGTPYGKQPRRIMDDFSVPDETPACGSPFSRPGGS